MPFPPPRPAFSVEFGVASVLIPLAGGVSYEFMQALGMFLKEVDDFLFISNFSPPSIV